jgi:hypothetical protein
MTGSKCRRRRAEKAPKMPVEVRLITKPGGRGDLGKRGRSITLGDESARLIQTHQQLVLMRRVTGELPKG